MFIRKLLLVGLCICEPIVRLTDSWSIGLLGTSHKGEDTCKAEQGCDAGSPPGGAQGGRGAFSRPAGPGEGAKPGKQPWWIPLYFSWMVGISWRLIQDAAHTSLEYCGTLCASIGLAARWSYWLVTAAVIVFLVQLSVWTFNWVVFPLCKYCLAVWRYLRGQGQWYEIAHLQGFRVFRPKWIGPRGQEEWTSAYVQNEVRGRGDNREPHDLLVTDGIAIARLRHGTLRGRTNRHGFRAECESVHSSSHRYFRNQLEGHECRVHLCGSTPCGQPDDDCIHALATAIIPRNREMDLQEAAGRGPLARCATAAWLCGYNSCGMLQSLAKAVRRGLSCLCCCGGCRSGRRRSAAHRERAPSGGSTPRHEDSETESEGEEGHVCQAEAVAYVQGGKAVPLSLSPCRDSARGPKIKLLASDAEVSSSADLLHEDGNSYFAACSHHRAAYEGQAFKRTCAIEGCGKEVKFVRSGLRLCKSHSSREKEVKGRGSRQDQDSVLTPLPATAEARFAPGGRPGDGAAAKEREEPVAGDSNSARTSDGRRKAALLGKYLTLILEGKDEREALSSCVEGDTGPHETWEILKEQASGYVARLPRLPRGGKKSDHPPHHRRVSGPHTTGNYRRGPCPGAQIAARAAS